MFLVLLIFIHSANGIINQEGPTVVSDFTNCITRLIEYNFKESGVLIFASIENDGTSVSRIKLEVLKNLHGKSKYNIQIVTSMNDEAEYVCNNEKFGVLNIKHLEAVSVAKYYMIIIENYKEFLYIVSKIICSRNWNSNARFMILLFNFANDGKIKDKLEEILTYLFKYNVIKIAIIVPHAKKNRNAIVYSWKPLDPPRYCGYFNETAQNRLLVENVCEHGIANHDRDLFKQCIPSDMKGCVLNILALEKQPFVSGNENDPNLEKKLINQMLAKINFKINYEILRGYRGERKKNGNWSGALKTLASKKGQMLLGAIYPDYDVHEDFECSTTYLADSYTWVVPRAYLLPPWRALAIIFKKSVWYSIIGGFLVSVLSWRVLGKLSSDSAYNQSLNHCFLNAWITTVGFCNYARPTKESLRVFCIFFNLYCLLFLTAYQTKLMDVLKNPTFEYQIKTTEELGRSGLKFGGFEELHDLFVNSSDPFDYYLGEQWIDVDDMYKALIDVVIHRNFSVLSSRLELAHMSAVIPELSDEFGNNRYYAFDRNMLTVPMEIVAMKGFPFMSKFSSILEVFRQSGINVALRSEYATFNMRRRARLIRSLNEKSEIKPLSVQHLKGAFLALALGYISGSIILVLEIVYQSSFIQNIFL